MNASRKLRLAYLVTHPIQYQAPLLRRINAEPDIDLTVFFGTDFSARPFVAADFGQTIEWDVPLLEGYRHDVLPAIGSREESSSLPRGSRSASRKSRSGRGARSAGGCCRRRTGCVRPV